MKTHIISFHKCVLCICNLYDYENKQVYSKGNLQDGKDSFHVTLVKDDGEQ